MFKNYENYLTVITNKINSFFEKQKPFIFCKKGCNICCENGQYPFSEMEFKYALSGFFKLDEGLRSKILNKVYSIKTKKAKFTQDGAFTYECPFLINKSCAIYNYRGIVCRSFGLLAQREGKPPAIPFCTNLGLNYSNVYDPNTKTISNEMFIKSGIKVKPLIFNVSYEFLKDETFEKAYNFRFGDVKPLIEWFD